MNREPKVLSILAGGGHRWQMLSLVSQLGGQFQFIYVIERGGVLPEQLPVPGEVVRVRGFSSFSQAHNLARLLHSLRSLAGAFLIMIRVRPTHVIAVGSSLIIPFAVLSRLFGAKTIFVESITRVEDLSATGRFLYRYRLATLIYAQWPEAALRYPGVAYRGTVL